MESNLEVAEVAVRLLGVDGVRSVELLPTQNGIFLRIALIAVDSN
jgi:hypothetical protein